MIAPKLTKCVRGVELRSDPAREPCFVIARHEAEVRSLRDYRSPEVLRSMLHREFNNEVQNAEVAAEMLVDFPEAPWDLRMDLARQCWDETRHAQGFLRRVIELGGHKGESPIKNGDWGIVGMIDSLAGRLLVQHRLFEGGAIDAFKQMARQMRALGDHRTAALYEVVLADEVQHVRFANRWLRALSADPRAVMQMAKAQATLRRILEAMKPRPGDRSLDGVDLAAEDHGIDVNTEDRTTAGFTLAEITGLQREDRALRSPARV